MAPKYRLIYFDLTGLGEPIRFLLHYGGIQFEDVRVSKEEWAALKSSTPLGQVPILEVDGKQLYQSSSIARYVAKQVGLTGKTDLENWEIDAAVDTVNDLRMKIAQWAFEPNEESKKKLKEALEKESKPFLLSKLDSWAQKNGGYLAVGRLTWADLFAASVLDFLEYLGQESLFSNYPNLQKVKNNVFSNPKIKAWIDKRPKDSFF